MKYIITSLFVFYCLINVCLAQENNNRESIKLNEIIDLEAQYSQSISSLRKIQWIDDAYGIEQRKEQLQELIKLTNAIENEQLSLDEQITYDFLVLVLNDRLDLLNLKSHLMPLNSEGGFLTSMFYSTQYLFLSDQDRKANYLKKLKDTKNYLQHKQSLLETGLKEQITVPKLVVNNTLKILDTQLSSHDSLHFLLKPVMRSKDKAYIDECFQLFVNEIKPAFRNFEKYLNQTYLPKTRSVIGVSENSNGKAFYEQRTKFYTTLDMSPQDVFDLGQQEVTRIRTEMEQIIKALKFQGSFSDFFEFLRTDPQFYAKSPKELLQEASWLSKKAEEFLPEYFETLPRLPFTVKPVPDDIAPSYTAGRYSGGSLKDMRAGSYWVNTYNLDSRPLYALPALTLHEAVPGHHLQGSLAQEMKAVPEIRSNIYLSAFGEGWALYCEYLGQEAGYYRTLYDEFGKLTYEMWRACRLVVDPGMHYFGWTREQAVEFMSSNTALSLHEVNTEIDRYIGWPGQAVSYKVGELKIRSLRKKCEKELDEDFDIRAFHKVILENGSVPLSTLEHIVNRYIQTVKLNEKK